MKLTEAAKKVEDGIDETLTYMEFPVPALAEDTDKQCHRADESGDSAAHTGGWRIPGWESSFDAGMRKITLCFRKGVGHEAVFMHEVSEREP